MQKYSCDICGRKFSKSNRLYGYSLCKKHMHQYLKHRKFLDNNPRTESDLNEFRFLDDGSVEFDCYNKRQEVVAKFVIDAEDLQKVRYHKWRVDTNNRVITGNCTTKNPRRELSRFLLDINDDDLVVDHVDGNSLNNRKSNLRPCTQSENLCNRHFMSNNTSGTIGVYYDKHRRRWAPEIRKGYTRYHLGRYKTKEEAIFVRKYAEERLFGEYQAYRDESCGDELQDSVKSDLMLYVDAKLGNQLH